MTLTPDIIDPEAVRRSVEDVKLGGVVMFVGEVRAVTGGRSTSKLEYAAYDAMALEEMRRVAASAESKWDCKVALAHRIGELAPGEVAVVTVAACAHRAEAFDCCRYLIDSIKREVPIWKREYGSDGTVWIEGDARIAGP